MQPAVIAALALAVAAGGCEREPASAPRPGASPRVVTLTPSSTEVVAALGATALLVGVDDYSKFPAEVERLPRVGTFLTPNLESIVSLRPTLVVVDDIHNRAAARLGDLGIVTAPCPMHSLADVKIALRTLGSALGRDAVAAERIASIDRALDATAAQRPALRPRVLLVIDRVAGDLGGMVAAGPGSWLDELVAVAGGQNVLAGAGVRYPKISRVDILSLQPDLILDASYVADPATALRDWSELPVPAVKSGRVRVAKDAFLLAPSPRVEAALARVAELLR